MAEPSVKIKFFADDKAAIAAFTALERKVDGLQNKLKFQKKQDPFKSMVRTSGTVLQNIIGFAGPLGAALALIRLFKAEFEDLMKRQRDAAAANVNFAGGLRGAFAALGEDPDIKGIDALKKVIFAVSKKTGVSPRATSVAFQSALSARGGLKGLDAAKAVEAALTAFPNIEGAQIPQAGAVLDIRKLRPEATAEDVIGFGLAIGRQSRVTEPEQIARNIIPSAIAISLGSGTSLRESGALVAVLSQAMQDVEGRRTRTAGIGLSRQLKVAFPKLKDVTERIGLVQQNPEARKAFFEGGEFEGRKIKRASFEKTAADAIENLLSKDGIVGKAFTKAISEIPEVTEGSTFFKEFVSKLATESTQQVEGVKRRLAAFTELQKLKDTTGALAGVTREGVLDALSSLGVGPTRRALFRTEFELLTNLGTKDPLGGSITGLERRARNLEVTKTEFSEFGSVIREVPPTPAEAEQASGIREMITLLKDINANIKKQKLNKKAHGEEAPR